MKVLVEKNEYQRYEGGLSVHCVTVNTWTKPSTLKEIKKRLIVIIIIIKASSGGGLIIIINIYKILF